MAGINSISGITGPAGSPGVAQPAAQKRQVSGGGFARTLKDYVNMVDQQQRGAGMAIQDLVSGKSQGVLPVVTAVADADMSFKLLIGVRNKVIEAYKQTMNMQI